MSHLAVVHSVPVDDVVALPRREWVDDVRARLVRSERLLTLYGRPGSAGVIVTAVFEVAIGDLVVVRMSVDPVAGYHALTADFPAAHCFERELHEQHGVRVAGHPWLKPLRFEDGNREEMNEYPFYKIDGKEIHEVAVGPIHAGVIEPGSFRFMCLGEIIHHLEIHLGYQHRGVEHLLLQSNARSLAPLVETIAGDTSIAHTLAYCSAIEVLARVDVSTELDAARGIALELERVAMHLSSLSGLAGDIGFLQGASTYARLRTTTINTTMRLCGSRFGRGAVRPRGGGINLDETGARDLRKTVELLQTDLPIIDACFLASRTVQHRLRDAGRLTRQQAIDLGLVGLAARASGSAIDQRSAATGIYGTVPIRPAIEESGDCWARANLRIRELTTSLQWMASVLDRFPLSAPVRDKVGDLEPSRLVITLCEGWRGEVLHALETDETGALIHYKVQDPSLRNWLGLAISVRENEISDFPMCNKSFDLSYCGHDL